MLQALALLVLGNLNPLHGSTPPAPALEGRPLNLTCERRFEPLGIDARKPRLSWWVGDPSPGAVQTAYQVVVASSVNGLDGSADVWDSGRVESDQSLDIGYQGPALETGRRYHWKVRTWNRDGAPSPWSKPTWWEMGLLKADDWKARWIGMPKRNTAASAPAAFLRKPVSVDGKVLRARIYATARGLFEMRLNGGRVGNDYFTPGWTNYRKTNQYLVYDVTSALRQGVNVLGAILGDGWHNGHLLLIEGGRKNWYGDDTSLLAQLVIEYEDGRRQVIGTDDTWSASTGPILESDLYNGEYYDARRELRDGVHSWDSPEFNAIRWATARVVDAPAAAPVAKVNPPIRPQETIEAVSIRLSEGGEWIFDFGQVVTGWAKIRLKGRAGHTIMLRFGEMLEPDGSLHIANMRSAKSTDRYVFAGDDTVEWEPSFTYHGFRYVGVSGLDGEPDRATVKAVVVHADLSRTGYLETSDSNVNRLQENIWWSQRGNAYDVPTDCPQRDERLGWTGDANFFLPTASFNYDVSAFIEKWMGDLRDAQYPDGRFTVYAPAPDDAGEAAAYSDGGVICPWIVYERYGDRRILADNFDAMKAWIEFQRRTSDGLVRPPSGYGDWLAPVTDDEGKPTTPRELIGTAFFAHSTDLARRAAEVLGRAEDARELSALHRKIVAAFQERFIGPDGLIVNATATSHALALEFDLLPEASRDAAVRELVHGLSERVWKIPTGFVGTPILMRVLKRFGKDEAAYHLLLQREYPGWMYMVDLGATTIWERWNSWQPEAGFGDQIGETGFGDVNMNSFNHTVWGAVGEWMYAVIGGIDVVPSAPGYKHIMIRPRPGGNLTWAKAALDSPYGRISTHWKRNGRAFELEVVVPPNTRATVSLPDGRNLEIGAGTHTFGCELPTSLRPAPDVADFKYGDDSARQTFDFWRAKTKGPAPLVLLIHGGGWIRGDKSLYNGTAVREYLDAGISVAAINYRFIDQAMRQGIEPPAQAPLLDAARALQTLRAHAKEWGIDTNRVGATGGSAGGCTSLWLAMHDDLADPKSPDPIARQSTRLTAIAVNSAQVSLDPKTLCEWIPNSEYAGHAFGFAAPGRRWLDEFKLLVGARERLLPWIKEYSPIEHVSKDDPPVFLDFPNEKTVPTIGEAQKDPTHSAVQGIKLAEAMEVVGVEAVVNYPANRDARYGSIPAFLIAKLNAPSP